MKKKAPIRPKPLDIGQFVELNGSGKKATGIWCGLGMAWFFWDLRQMKKLHLWLGRAISYLESQK